VRRWGAPLVALVAAVAWAGAGGARAQARRAAAARPVVVASKPFGESYVLAELFAQLLEARGYAVVRRPGLGATQVAYAAVRSGAVDVYPEYTGTVLRAVLGDSAPARDAGDAFARVARLSAERDGVRWLPPLGFENRFALAVRGETARRYGLRTVSDLARAAPRLTGAFSSDFLGRADGLPGLARAYDLRLAAARPLAPAVKYQAVVAGDVDVIDAYSTEGLVARYGLVVLDDDRRFFPPYEAAPLASAALVRDVPGAALALTELAGRLDEATVRELNRRQEVDGEPAAGVAAGALRALGLAAPGPAGAPNANAAAGRPARGGALAYAWAERRSIAARAGRHLALTGAALAAACLVGVPLGLWLERRPRVADLTVRGTGVLQTIPGIALLAFLVPLLGVGVVPAFVALFLYGLYPVVRATYTGVRDAAPGAVAAAHAMGMTPGQVLREVRLPLAAPVLMGGVRTAAVLGVGTATLAAFVGGGGLGETIAAGLALGDARLVLAGAVPAAALAVVVDYGLALVERAVEPRGLHRAPATARRSP
jgi:osmoprotectant transport system permease protein